MADTHSLLNRLATGRVASLAFGAILIGIGAVPTVRAGGGHDMSHCVSVDHNSNSIADFIINSCDAIITVRWTDQGDCRNWSCTDFIGARSKSSENKMKGAFMLAACLYPE